jgi:hypothetical protein
MCFRLPATGGAPWTSTQDSFAAVRAQRTWKAVAYEWRRGLAAKEYINIHDTTWLSGSSVRAHPTHRPEKLHLTELVAASARFWAVCQ